MPTKHRAQLKISFWLALIGIFLAPIYFPRVHLFFFAPFLVISFYHHERLSVLWRAYGTGIILDLLTSGPFFGLSSLNYCLTTYLLYPQRRNFFADKVSTLPLMTYLFSFISTLINLVLALFFGQKHPLGASWLLTDLVLMPLADATYALLVFSMPFQLLSKLKRLRLTEHS